jgi:hypothetical protein
VTEPAPDYVDLDAGLEEVNGGRVAKDVGADPTSGARVIEASSMAAHDLVDAKAGEWLSTCREDRAVRRRWRVHRLEQRGQKSSRLAPEWACAPLVALAVQAHEWMVTEIEVFNTKISSLLHTRSGVVEEEQEGSVPQSEAPIARQMAEQTLDFVPFQESCLRWSGPLHWHACHALADEQHFRRSPSDVLEKAVQRGQALIARANVVSAVHFEMLEKADDAFVR